MIDAVGTMKSESEEENEGSAENNNIHTNEKEIVQEKTTDLSEAWMIDDVGTIESESEEDDESSPESKKSTDKEDISENKQKVKEDTIYDLSEAWMIDDVGAINSEESDEEKDFLEKERKVVIEKIKTIQEKMAKSSANKGFRNIPVKDSSNEWMNDEFVVIENEEDIQTSDSPVPYDEDDKETQVYASQAQTVTNVEKDGRLSVIEEALRFSCEDEEDEGNNDIEREVLCCEDESTSWAFVASKEPTQATKKPVAKRTQSSSSNPALIVEIIEKEPQQETLDSDGYKVVKGKTKTKQKKKSKEIPDTSIKAFINQLDQPIDKVKSEIAVESPALVDDFEEIEVPSKCAKEYDNSQEEKDQSEQQTYQDNETDNFQEEDPWLAVKEEYARKGSPTQKDTKEIENEDFTIEVKVSTKETCLRRKLHQQNNKTEWKMDIECTQKKYNA
jgi:hypothetical protein